MMELEEIFEAPVIESYGMTEAAHQMASNPLPPLRRKPGSVGVPAGPQIALFDDEGRIRAGKGITGEVVIRGPNVTPGYEANPGKAPLGRRLPGYRRHVPPHQPMAPAGGPAPGLDRDKSGGSLGL